MRAFAYERPTDLGDAVALLAEHGPEARLLAGGTDLIIRLRDGTIRPRVVVDVKGDRRARRRTSASGDGELIIGARTVMTDIAADERIRRDYQALAEAAAVVGCGPDPEPGDAGRQHLQRLAGGRHGAGAARLRRAWSWLPVRSGVRRIPIDEFFVRSGVTTLGPRRAGHGDRAAAPDATRRGSVHVRRTRRRGHDLASVTLACAVVGRWGRRGSPTAASGRDRCSSSDETGLLADPAAPEGAKLERLADAVRRRQPVAAVDAGEPRVPPGDAPRARPAGGRRRRRAPRRTAATGRDDDAAGST